MGLRQGKAPDLVRQQAGGLGGMWGRSFIAGIVADFH